VVLKEYRDMERERPVRNYGFRIVVLLAVLANLILTIAVITQLRELQQRVASLPPDAAIKRDVAMLRPLRIREIITQNCVECHSTRRLGVTVSMEPSEVQRTVERMQNHPGANISPGEFERITASLLVARCARCHGEETLNLMVLKTQPERLATIRRMAALPGSGVRADQVLAIDQAFEKLIDRDARDSTPKSAQRIGGQSTVP
jgi:cytochrome c553